MLKQYLKQISCTVEQSTLTKYSTVLEEFTAMVDNDITLDSMAEYIEMLGVRGNTRNTIWVKLSIVKAWLKYEGGHSDALALASRFKPEALQPLDINEEQLRLIIEGTSNPEWRLAVLLGAYAGLRISETWRVNRSTYHDGKLFITDTKNKVDRVVPVVNEILRSALERYTGNFFEGKNENSFQVYLSRKGKQLGIKGLHSHTLRRYFITRLFSKGVPLPLIMKLVGHKTPTVTLHYSGISEEMLGKYSLAMA